MLPNHSTTACWHGKAVVRGTNGVRPALLDCLRRRWCCHAGWVRLPTAEGVPRAGGGAPGRKECFPALGATGAGCTGCGATARVDEGAQRAPHPNGLSVGRGGGGQLLGSNHWHFWALHTIGPQVTHVTAGRQPDPGPILHLDISQGTPRCCHPIPHHPSCSLFCRTTPPLPQCLLICVAPATATAPFQERPSHATSIQATGQYPSPKHKTCQFCLLVVKKNAYWHLWRGRIGIVQLRSTLRYTCATRRIAPERKCQMNCNQRSHWRPCRGSNHEVGGDYRGIDAPNQRGGTEGVWGKTNTPVPTAPTRSSSKTGESEWFSGPLASLPSGPLSRRRLLTLQGHGRQGERLDDSLAVPSPRGISEPGWWGKGGMEGGWARDYKAQSDARFHASLHTRAHCLAVVHNHRVNAIKNAPVPKGAQTFVGCKMQCLPSKCAHDHASRPITAATCGTVEFRRSFFRWSMKIKLFMRFEAGDGIIRMIAVQPPPFTPSCPLELEIGESR